MITQVTTCYCSSRAAEDFSPWLSPPLPVCLSSSNTCSSPSLTDPIFPCHLKLHIHVVDRKVGVKRREASRKRKIMLNKSEHLHGSWFYAKQLQGKQMRRTKLTFLALLPVSCASSLQSCYDKLFFLFFFWSFTLAPSFFSLFSSSRPLWLSPSHFLSTLLLEKQLEETPLLLSALPGPPSVSLNMVLMRCWTFILTVHWSQNHVSVAHSHVSLLVRVWQQEGG